MADHLAAPPARSRGLPTKTSRPDVRPDGVGLESRETCAQRPPAPGHVLVSLVQASGGDIGARAGARAPILPQLRPFAPPALKGQALPPTLPPSPPPPPMAPPCRARPASSGPLSL